MRVETWRKLPWDAAGGCSEEQRDDHDVTSHRYIADMRQYGFGSEDTRSGIGSPPFARSLTHVLLPAAGGPMTTKRARVPHSPSRVNPE